MAEEKEKQKQKSNSIWVFIATFVVVGLIALLITLLNYKSEKNTSVDFSTSEKGVLVCDAGPLEGSFFSVENASQVQHQVKVSFTDDQVTKFFYMYSGKLKDEDAAERGSTDMNIKYDKYLGVHKSKVADELSATFNHPETSVRIDIFTGAKGIDPTTATFFFLDSEKLNELMKKDGDGLKKYYEEKNFDCKYEK